jgi:hypothetical protein
MVVTFVESVGPAWPRDGEVRARPPGQGVAVLDPALRCCSGAEVADRHQDRYLGTIVKPVRCTPTDDPQAKRHF